jgi:hypothetical protein
MRALEETLNPMLLVHFLLIVGGMCFATFSAVTVGEFAKLKEATAQPP